MNGFLFCEINTKVDSIASVVLPVLAAFVIATFVWKALQLKKLQRNFNDAIILVPLYKNNGALIFGFVVVTLIGAGAVAAAILVGYPVAFLSIAATCVCADFTFSVMRRVKFAVMDSGVLVPYRFVSWHEFYDYCIFENEIIISGDKLGRQTLSSTTIALRFNPSDLAKLELILGKNRVKHKRNY